MFVLSLARHEFVYGLVDRIPIQCLKEVVGLGPTGDFEFPLSPTFDMMNTTSFSSYIFSNLEHEFYFDTH